MRLVARVLGSNNSSKRRYSLLSVFPVAMMLFLAGCGGSSQNSNSSSGQGLVTPPPPSQINKYLGSNGDIWNVSLDHTNSQVTGKDITKNGLGLGQPYGSAAGAFTTAGKFMKFSLASVPTPPVTTGDPSVGGLGVDIPGRGAIVRFGDVTNSVVPLIPSESCPAIQGTASYIFISIPNAAWSNQNDIAYGTFQVSVTGQNWNFAGVTQFTLAGMPPSAASTPLPTGYCGLSTTGYSVTAASSPDDTPPIATVTMGFGPSGLFVEDNGSEQSSPSGVIPSNGLGGGAGAVGVVQPSVQLSTSDVVGAQYAGFFYEPVATVFDNSVVTQAVSFGCAGSSCPAPPNSTSMVGGTFPGDDPTQMAKTNLVIDLGPQDPTNGLYPKAQLTVSGVSFPAVAIVGNPEGKFVIYALAQDTIRGLPAAFYLFQQ